LGVSRSGEELVEGTENVIAHLDEELLKSVTELHATKVGLIMATGGEVLLQHFVCLIRLVV
jgi:hypothetical protein